MTLRYRVLPVALEIQLVRICKPLVEGSIPAAGTGRRAYMKLRNFGASLLAGFCATTVHVVLTTLKHRAGILPAFEPYADLQRLLSGMIGRLLEPALSWLISYIDGALILGFLFGRLYVRLPGASALGNGALFGFAAWLGMGLGLLPVVGRGIFARELGLRALPAVNARHDGGGKFRD
jgi:hypothetical protein